MLLSAGEPLPSDIFVHGFLTVEGRKISKSLGNAIDPVALVEQYGRDALRYYLLRKVPATGDADYTRDEFVRTHNADLADQLGNLLNRVTKMIVQYCAGIVPAPGSLLDVDRAIINATLTVQQEVECELADFALHKAIGAVWALIAAVNKYIVETEPWRLARNAREENGATAAAQRLATTLFVPAAALFYIARLLRPFLPDTAAAIIQQLGLSPDADEAVSASWGQVVIGTRVQPGALLFPKFVVDAAPTVV
jgi:methionyl-tRNA synthetase